MLRYKNVRLVKIDESSKKLMEKSIVTATITGSPGWESLMKNKACIVFGNPWYSACNSCYVVNSVEECRNALNSILKKTQEGVEIDVLKFLAFYKDKFVHSTNSYYFATRTNVEYQILVDNLSISLNKEINETIRAN